MIILNSYNRTCVSAFQLQQRLSFYAVLRDAYTSCRIRLDWITINI